ncbi:MAG TPA: hypothetical protein VGD14_21615 [bacterium]
MIKKKNIDLSNLALMLKEIIHQLEQLDENEIETLEILLDDELMKALEEVKANPEFIPLEEFLTNVSNKHQQKSHKAVAEAY